MTDREKLVEELEIYLNKHNNLKSNHSRTIAGIVSEFIIKDRERIVEPIYDIHKGEFTFKQLFDASVQVLTRAGVN